MNITPINQALVDAGFVPAPIAEAIVAMKIPPYPSTPKQARAWFKRYGICIADWCRHMRLDHGAVIDLLRGKSKGTRGKAHKAAIALGLKEDPEKSHAKNAA